MSALGFSLASKLNSVTNLPSMFSLSHPMPHLSCLWGHALCLLSVFCCPSVEVHPGVGGNAPVGASHRKRAM